MSDDITVSVAGGSTVSVNVSGSDATASVIGGGGDVPVVAVSGSTASVTVTPLGSVDVSVAGATSLGEVAVSGATASVTVTQMGGDRGPKGDVGQSIELQSTATHLQWRVVGGTTWTNLVPLSEITGPQGPIGQTGSNGANGSNGVNGSSVELRSTSTHIQWRLVGAEAWTNIVALSTITGPPGSGGSSLPESGLTITLVGGWAPQQPTQIFSLVPAQAVQAGNTYTRYFGKWIVFWSYSESNWSTTGGPRVSSLTFDDLEGTTSVFSPSSMGAITTLSLPVLRYVGNNFTPSTMGALTTLSVPQLSFVGGGFNPNSLGALTTLSLPALSYVLGSFAPNSLGALTTLSLPALSYVGGSFTPSSLGALTTLSLPALSYVGGPFSPSGVGSLANVTLPADGTLKFINGSVTMTGMALTVTSVDNILQSLATLDGTNNTGIYGTGRFVDLSGGTSAAPSNLGSTTRAGSSFVCNGTTCTVSWPGHGYTTGTVLRVSGIATATNANRYAVITVQNANQFTYTISSQVATGSGTATVVRAGASASALVTRGVTLTTN